MTIARPFEQFTKQRTVKHPKVQAILDKFASVNISERAAEIRGDKDRSAEWKNTELRKLTNGAILDLTKNGVHELARLRRTNEARRPTLPKLDRNDFVSALEDNEWRSVIRAMPYAERLKFVSDLGADSRAVAAVMRGTPETLNVPPQIHAAAVARVMQATHGATYAAIAETQEDLEVGEAAVGLLMNEVRDAAEPLADFQWQHYVAETRAPLNAELAKEFARPAPKDGGVDSLVETAQAMTHEERRTAIDRLLEVQLATI
jgi:hypothetical protein